MGLDYRIWRVMILAFILAAGLMGYKLMDRQKCKPVNFVIKTASINDSVYYTDELLAFTALSNEKDITWDFNDKTAIEQGPLVTHRFKTEGKYYIKVTEKSGCDSVYQITIKKSIVDTVDNVKEKIKGTDRTFVKADEIFTCLVNATHYEWNIAGHPEFASRNGAATTYKFLQPGNYTIELTLNHDLLKKYRKIVKVIDVGIIPPPPPPPPTLLCAPKTIISDETFKGFIEKVVIGEYAASDFNDYLGYGGAIPVIINGDKKKPKDFTATCKYLNGKRVKQDPLAVWKRLIKIKSVITNRDKNKCILSIEINYD